MPMPRSRGFVRSTALLAALAVGLFLLARSAPTAHAFYVPGAKETSYEAGKNVSFWVNSLRSSSEVFPIDYYAMPFCAPSKPVAKHESIGELVWGDRQYSSLYAATMLENVTCTPVPNCDAEKNTEALRNSKTLEKMVNRFYRVYMNIDNLPAFSKEDPNSRMSACARQLNKDDYFVNQRGYPLGLPAACSDQKKALLNNHLSFKIYYNYDSASSSTEEKKAYIVVGLEVEAVSIAWPSAEACSKETSIASRLTGDSALTLDAVKSPKGKVFWTYGYTWIKSDLKWATRWDFYLTSGAAAKPANHLLSVFLSLTVVLFIGSSVLFLLMRALHKDFNRYNSADPEDLQEETGWKLIHADVFRPPFHASWLAIFVANGCQIIATATVVLVVALMGFLSPSRRGGLLSAMFFTAIFTSIVGGYVCGVLLQYLNCRAWKHIFLCSFTLPGGVLLAYLFISIINKVHGATTAVPFLTLLEIIVMVIAVSVPLTVLGGSIAFRQQPISNPTRVGRLAREIPEQSLLNTPIFMYSFFPCVPLIVALIEVYYIMQDLWAGQIYYSFGFLSLTALIWAMTCALATISCLYYVLCYENHRWWWVAFLVPGGAGLHMFVVAVVFYITQLNVMSFASGVLFFTYMGLFAYMYGLAAGAIGVITSILFVRIIYASIKID